MKLSNLVKVHYVLRIIRDFLLIAICGCFLFGSYFIYENSKDAPKHLENILANGDNLTSNGKQLVFRINAHLTNDWLKNLDNNINTSVITGQQAVNTYQQVGEATTRLLEHLDQRSSKAIEKLTDSGESAAIEVKDLVHRVSNETLPNVSKATEQVTRLASNGADTLDTSNRTIGHFDGLLRDQRIVDTMGSLASASAKLDTISGITADKLPALFDSSTLLLTNTGGFMKQAEIAGINYNKPITFKSILFKAGTNLFINQVPFITTTLFKR